MPNLYTIPHINNHNTHNKDTPLFSLIPWLLIALLLIAPFYYHPNASSGGLFTPKNSFVWIVASLIGFYSLYKITQARYFLLPRHFLLLLAFPVLVFVSGLLSGIHSGAEWIFRLLFIWGGLLFLFALFQYGRSQKQLDIVLFLILMCALLQSITGIIQIFIPNDLFAWWPFFLKLTSPSGFFQQINNQASFQATSIIIGFWLLTRPFSHETQSWRFGLLLLGLVLSTFILVQSGSRAGAIGVLLAIPLFILSRWRFITRHKKRWIGVLVILVLAVTAGITSKNNSTFTDKMTRIDKGYSANSRLGIYKISWDLIKEKPIFGHGIGSFDSKWQFAKPAFYAQHPEGILPSSYVDHPHNETLFWLVEGGLVAGIGLLLVLIAILLTLRKLPPSRRYVYLALILPIGIHTQLELPFYTSAIHWFVFLILLWVILFPLRQQKEVALSQMARVSLKVTAIMGATLTTLFLVHSVLASNEMSSPPINASPEEGLFPLAIQNPYFRPKVTMIDAVKIIIDNFEKPSFQKHIEPYAKLIEHEITSNPKPEYFDIVAVLYEQNRNIKKACLLAKKGLSIYPNNKPLKSHVKTLCK